MIVKDNFLSEKEFKELQDLMLSQAFPWYYNDGVNEPSEENLFQFTHMFFGGCFSWSSNYEMIVKLFKEKLDVKCFIRIKANLTTITQKPVEQGFHTDLNDNTTAIFYLNTNNGYTEFENGKIVNCVANRLVEFDSNIKHQPITSTDSKRRVVINFNYYKMKPERYQL